MHVFQLLCADPRTLQHRKVPNQTNEFLLKGVKMESQTFLITLDGVTSDLASRYAGELQDELLDTSSEVTVDLKRDDSKAQDFGSTLVLVLGAPAVVVIARALGEYLQRRRGVTLTVKTPAGEVIAEKLTSKDAMRIVEIMSKQSG
jgi:hypothetical protein